MRWLFLLSGIILFSGCVTERVILADKDARIPLAAQWRESIGSEIRVAEIVFPFSHPENIAPTVKIGDLVLTGNSGTNLNAILWWQFSDISGTKNPGKLLRVAYRQHPKKPLLISIQSNQNTTNLALPLCVYPKKRIEALSRLNKKEIALKIATDEARPIKLFINGAERSFKRFRDKADFLITKLDATETDTKPLFIDIDFADGESRFTQCYLPSEFLITLDAADENACKKLNIDKNPFFTPMQKEDVSCTDINSRKDGTAIPFLLKESEEKTGVPLSLHFCTSVTPFALDAYSSLADAVTTSALSFLASTDTKKRLRRETEALSDVIKTVRPKPILWFAPLFKRNDIHLTYDEANYLFLSSVALGVKGVRCHLWAVYGEDNKGLIEIEELQKSVKFWLRLRDKYNLPALLPYSKISTAHTEILTAIEPMCGMLVVWNTKDVAEMVKEITLSMPRGCKAKKVRDIVSGDKIQYSQKGNTLKVTLPKNLSYGALWVDMGDVDMGDEDRKVIGVIHRRRLL